MATKLIMSRDIERLGAAGEVVEVKDGYARNFLIPRGYAVRWTKGAQRHIDNNLERLRKSEINSVEDAIALRERIEGEGATTVTVKAGANGRLFGAVSPKHMATALQAQFGVPFDPRNIDFESTIKRTGTYAVTIKLLPEVVAKTELVVVAADA